MNFIYCVTVYRCTVDTESFPFYLTWYLHFENSSSYFSWIITNNMLTHMLLPAFLALQTYYCMLYCQCFLSFFRSCCCCGGVWKNQNVNIEVDRNNQHRNNRFFSLSFRHRSCWSSKKIISSSIVD